MPRCLIIPLAFCGFLSFSLPVCGDEFPDIREVPADLAVPPLQESPPAAGQRVRIDLPNWESTSVSHTLYLPKDWQAGRTYPVLVELPGNGGYHDARGDTCSGLPDGCSLGYGISEGTGYIWICLPFLNDSGTATAVTWWGDAPNYRPQATLKYWKSAIDHVCRHLGGDRQALILCGFSRGAIACNALGLHDEEIAAIWRAFIVCSHYDGVRTWPFSATDPESPSIRQSRLRGRPQFICGEGRQITATRDFLQRTISDSSLTFISTGFRNHNDQWILRPSPAREQLREWLKGL